MKSFQEVKSFCDASFSPKHKIGVIGWKIGESKINTKIITDTDNSSAELICLLDLLKNLDLSKNNIIYTDCESAVRRIKSKDEIISNGYRKNKKDGFIKNHAVYREIFCILNENSLQSENIIKINHIEGHIKKELMTPDNVEFSKVDRFIRKELRRVVKNLEIRSHNEKIPK